MNEEQREKLEKLKKRLAEGKPARWYRQELTPEETAKFISRAD